MLNTYIKQLVNYAVKSELLPECEVNYATNLILDLFNESFYEDPGQVEESELSNILSNLLNEAVQRGIIEDSIGFRDLFDTKIMNTLCPRPSEVQRRFRELYKESPETATEYFYKLSKASDYIRTYRIKNDVVWTTPSEYGDIDITINLSKPEKDPKAIAAALLSKDKAYPACQLCMTNEGYAGRLDHPARENLRIIPVTINNSNWGFQYSPYVYYNEHCIVFNGEHVPMKIERATFRKLLDFVKQFPHYFLGSNADLPIVGGSILTHDHFQGGNYEFSMAKAKVEKTFEIKGFEDVECGIVKWPMSVIRIKSKDDERLVELADHILDIWRGYTDEEAFIFAETEGTPHNTITPIARMRNGEYELDLVLRNNITTEEKPMGVYHPSEVYHNIKKENIGLIEVMGRAILPARLKEEMELVAEYLLTGESLLNDEKTAKHDSWVKAFIDDYDITKDNIHDILKNEIGKTFVKVLEDAGVYKRTEDGKKAFMKFIEEL